MVGDRRAVALGGLQLRSRDALRQQTYIGFLVIMRGVIAWQPGVRRGDGLLDRC